MSFKKLAANAIWSLLSHLVGRGSLVLASILLARGLDSAGFAAYSYFQLTVSMLAAYAAMGMGVTASRFFAESTHRADRQEPPLGTLWALSILAGLFFSTMVMCVPAAWINGCLGVPQYLLAVGIFSMSLGVVPSGAVLGLERYAEATVAAAVSGIVLVLGAVVASKYGSTLIAMWAFIFASLIQGGGDTLVVMRNIGLRRLLNHSRFGKTELKKIAGFAGPMLAVTLFSASGSWLVGRIILNSPSGTGGFALYAIGLQWFSLALLLPGIVSRVVLPRLVRIRTGSSPTSLLVSKMLVQQSALITGAVALTMCCFGVLFSPWLLKLYGANYEVDKWLIAAFMIAALPLAPANTLGNAIIAHDGQLAWLRITMVWFFFLIIVAQGFHKYGVWSGALAQGFASLLLTLQAFIWARKRGLA